MTDKKFYPATYVNEPATVRNIVKHYGAWRMLIGFGLMCSVIVSLAIAGVMFG